MSKKLVTKDESIIKTVENALGDVPHITFKASNGNIVLAVTNKNGDELIKAMYNIAEHLDKVHYGVLRGHPEYTVPRDLMTNLAERSYQYTMKQEVDKDEQKAA